MHSGSNYAGLIGPLFAVALILILRGRNVGRARPLKVERLWIVPVLYAMMAAGLLWQTPPRGLDWLWCALAMLAGAGVGWWRGSSIKLHVDPETHAINQTTSWATIGLVIVLILVKMGTKYEAAADGIRPAFLIDIFVLFAFGTLSMTRLEMYLRANRILRAHRAGAS